METERWSIYKMRKARSKSDVRNTYRKKEQDWVGFEAGDPAAEPGTGNGIWARIMQKLRGVLEEEDQADIIY